MMNHKKLLIGCGCALLAIALVVCLVLVIGNGAGDKPTLPSNGTTVTNPDGTTNPTDGTTPSGNTDPTGPDATTDPTTPSSGVTDPTVPTIDLTEPTTEPTEPPYSYPTEPNGDIIPIDPNEGQTTTPTTPPVVTPVDLGGYNETNITTEVWKNWSGEQRTAFLNYYFANEDSFSLDTRYYVAQQIGDRVWNDEEAIAKGIYAGTEEAYKSYLEKMALGCKFCGDTNCAAFYARAETGYTHYDYTKCPYYNEEHDPSIYCQECGYKRFGKCSSGETGCTRVVSKDMPCPDCGETVYVGKCHHCVHP
ncbi:MAG: hypothetical protein E7468_07030 [Ruminococcaceae bacterium]|nr:hypothetical protein [Oscillospiraceae bacterium]